MNRFSAEPDRVVWYHAAIAEALEPHRATAPIAEMEEMNARLAALLVVEVSV